MGEWREILALGVVAIGLTATFGYFASSCEETAHRTLTECLRAGRSAAECRLMLNHRQ